LDEILQLNIVKLLEVNKIAHVSMALHKCY